MTRADITRVLAIGTLAGVAGGLAEVAWISLYAAATGLHAASVARGVTDTLRLSTQTPVAAGIAIHMGIAAALGLAVTAALKPLRAHLDAVAFHGTVIAVLAAAWAINFLFVLPVVNPAFVAIVPFAVSFTSKLMFGAAAAGCLAIGDAAGILIPAARA